MEYNAKRRGFIKGAGTALGVAAAAGGVVALYGMKRTWDPLPSVAAAGITEIDVSVLKPGELMRSQFRGKPVYILKKSDEMQPNDARDVVIDNERYTVVIAICTHLGCIPAWNSSNLQFKCACHGGEFDPSGLHTFGPPPKPLVIPPFSVSGKKLVLGEEGEQYKKLAATA
ncbi:ubiquinol-cytochrome c reductase iron-sulfur subunit [Campylobacterota bacterium]|nr:ubiquinol-cytochrome c reductase iron-sulfur subunit [Campylobacterota bacterium]GHV07097.1 ubiquinol-cytochrome c reductase iron-sulfur subunit [Campylobacterota bacterium]